MLIVSDANPLHFVDADAETFNEKVYPNVQEVCFHDTWKCTSEVRTRIIDDDGTKEYVLRFLNKKGIQVGVDIPFVKTPIVNTNVSQPENNDFDLTTDPWELNGLTIGLGDAEWSWSANQGGSARATLASPSFPGDGDKTKDLKIDFSLKAGRTYTFKLTGEFDELANQLIRLYIRNSATAYNTSDEQITGGGFEVELSVTPTEDCNELIIAVENQEAAASFVELSKVELVGYSYGGIHDVAFTPQVVGLCGLFDSVVIVDATEEDEDDWVIVKKTDLLNFDEDTYWTLIEYKAGSNFAGMPYDENSPLFQFYLPCQFFRGRNKLEVVNAKLSGGIQVNTGSSMEQERKMIIDLVTDYKHNKFLIILQHAVNGTVKIDGEEWVLGEGASYDYKEPEQEDYPLQGAEIFLTRKNYGTNNII